MDVEQEVSKNQDDDALSTTSSMSFILAEELDNIDSPTDGKESGSGDAKTEDEVEVAMDPLMSQSQYAQVLFHDIEDFYENDNDLICNFTLYLTTVADSTTNAAGDGITLKHKDGDRIGIFRVPFIKPNERLFDVTVKEENVTAGKGMVTFTKAKVPKEEDFYQFQYLRGDDVLGASIPFQLKLKKDEQETQTEEAPDRMAALESKNQRLEESLNKATGDCVKLLTLSENLTDQLEGKSLSFIELEKSLQFEGQSCQQLKTDVAFLVQEKILLEQRLEKSTEQVKKLQREVDNLNGKYQTKDRENALLKEEKDQVTAKLDDAKAIIAAVTDSKLMAIKLLNEHQARELALKKEIEELKSGKSSSSGNNTPRWNRMEAKLHELEMSVSTTDEKFGKLFGDLADDVSMLRSAMTTRTPSLKSEGVQSEIGGDSMSMLDTNFINGTVATTEAIDAVKKEPSLEEPQVQDPAAAQGAASKASQKRRGDVLPIPILPVQTVEAMAAAAKGSVESIKQLLTPFRHHTDPFSECRIDIEGPCQATTVIDRQPIAKPSAKEDKRSDDMSDEVKVSLGQKTVTIPDEKDEEEPEVDNSETREQSPVRNEMPSSVVLTDDGRTITYTGDGNIFCPICTKEFQKDQIRELEFHVEEHITVGLTCPVCSVTMPKDMPSDFERHVALHFDEEISSFCEVAATAQQQTSAGSRSLWPFADL